MKRLLLVASILLLGCLSSVAQIGALLSGAAGPGRSVLNPTNDFVAAYHIINLMKTCNTLRGGTTWNFQAALNSNGYPLANLSSTVLCGATSPTFAEYSGSYVITWSGGFGASAGGVSASFRSGTVSVLTDCSPTCIASNVSTTLTLKGTNGYIEAQPSGPSSSCCSMTFIASVADTSITDIAIYRKDQESWLGTASISGTTLTRATTTSGALRVKDMVYSNGVAPGTMITADLGGGQYTVSISQTVALGRMSSAQIFNPDYISSVVKMNPRILRVGLAYGTPNSQSATRDAYTSQMGSMIWSGGPVTAFNTITGGGGVVSSGRAGAIDCGVGATTSINYCAALPPDSGASTYVDGETATGYVVNATSPFTVSVTGSISGTTLTTTVGTVDGLRSVFCTGCAKGTVITGGSGTTWTVNISQTVSSQAMSLFPTLKIGNKDPVMVGSSMSGAGAGSLQANRLYVFIYDDVQKLWLIQADGDSLYVPVEAQAELCNVVNRDCWFQPPYMFNDAAFLAHAQRISGSLAAPLLAYNEYANEVFADGGWGADATWIGNRGAALGMPGTYRDYYGYGFGRMMRQNLLGWSGSTSRVKGIETIFRLSPSITRDITERLSGLDLVLDANGFYTSGGAGSVQGYTTTTQLHVTAVNSGRIQQTMGISGNGIAGGVTVTDFNDPTTGGGSGGNDALALGTYTLSANVGTVCSIGAPCTWTLASVGTGNPVVTDWTRAPNRPVDFAEAVSTATYFHGPNLAGLNGSRNTEGNYVAFESATYAITAISQASTGVVTATGIGSAAKAFANGDRVQLTTVGGMTSLNSAFATVAGLSGDTFQLSNVTGTICCAPSLFAVNQGLVISSANPAVVSSGSTVSSTWLAGITAGMKIRFIPTPVTTSQGPAGALPAPVLADTDYYVLSSGLTASQFQFSTSPGGTAVDTTGGTSAGVIGAYVIQSNDTSALPAYTSGGVLKRIIPNLNDSLYTWADQYATGVQATQQTALTNVMNDVISGTRIASNNVAFPGDATVTSYQTTWGNMVPIMTAFPSLKYRQYEGAYDGATMTNLSAAELGISGLYPGKIYNLFIAFRNSDQHRSVNNLMMMNFINYPGLNARSPAQSVDFASSSVNLWATFPGTIYTPPLANAQAWSRPFTNFDAISNFNAGLQ